MNKLKRVITRYVKSVIHFLQEKHSLISHNTLKSFEELVGHCRQQPVQYYI
jgi:hypothetical protein